MLRELTKIAQIQGHSRRRWFIDDFFDLIVWYSADDRITGFQLCYNKDTDERALTWKIPSMYTHHRVDDGEYDITEKATPILIPDGMFDHRIIADRFWRESFEIDKEIVQLVYEKLINYK